MKRGWKGLGYCALCKRDTESVKHLFLYCKFSKKVWFMVYEYLYIQTSSGDTNLNESFKIFKILCLKERNHKFYMLSYLEHA